ncbi:MAG: glycoside hydrolase family 130 protein [Methylococcales bacterium]|nr:glycoside hydrolase family 130 protein [Methylococcales bacterium]
MEIIKPPKPQVRTKKTKINRDISRVITRLHVPENSRTPRIINRVLSLNENEAQKLMERIHFEFFDRHRDIMRVLKNHFDAVAEYIPRDEELSETKKMLIGAYFTMEYSVESAALFNPSIVPHPDQSNVPKGSLRYIMSFRSIGEGHISSISFRSGIIDNNNSFIFDPVSEFVETPDIQLNPVYDHHLFTLKLIEMNVYNETTSRVLDQLSDEFSYNNLKERINELKSNPDFSTDRETIGKIYWLAKSNYEIKFHTEYGISERVIFPTSAIEKSGIEDARFVQFFDDNGESTYYATYTAYSGFSILPQMIKTKDFITFNIITLNGEAVQNKGMALFPRMINGKYVMLSRQDGENNHIMFSDHLHFWQESKIIQEPISPWEFIQIGNCGSPLETSEGWLVLTHGVGPMRQYCISAILLDLENPEKIIGRLKEPLITPREGEREGYVPNVVYSCGSLIHNNTLVIPYAMSDIMSGIATVVVSELISSMHPLTN